MFRYSSPRKRSVASYSGNGEEDLPANRKAGSRSKTRWSYWRVQASPPFL